MNKPDNNLYFKRLDALRFIAFFLVFWQHCFGYTFLFISPNEHIQKIMFQLSFTGGIGVHLFFVISGFLITYLLLQEEITKGEINVPYFYLRRILRIWPLYYLIVILGLFVLPQFFHSFEFTGNYIKNMVFLNNFDMHHKAFNVAIAWSVAIEEQFYLFWPLLFLFIKNKTYLLWTSVFFFLVSGFFNLLYPKISYFHTLGNINFLMAGCIGALLFVRYNNLISKLLTPKLFLLVIVLIITLLILAPFYSFLAFYHCFIFPFMCVYLVLYFIKHDKNQPKYSISFLGKYTYGMYLYHPMLILLLKIGFDIMKFNYKGSILNSLIFGAISLSVTILVSILSYEFFEKFFLKYKYKFSFVKTRI